MFCIYFVRHGQTDWNFLRKLQGQQDIPLNDLGRQQAQAVSERLKRTSFDVLYSSDLSRAYETAEMINAHHGLPVIRDENLRERCFGLFEGLSNDGIQQRHPELSKAYREDKLNFQIPGGESRFEFIGRVGGFLEALRKRYSDQTIVVASHGGVLGGMVSHIISQKLGFESPKFIPLFSAQNCSISQLEYRNDEWLIKSLNQTDHLDGLIGAGQAVGEYS